MLTFSSFPTKSFDLTDIPQPLEVLEKALDFGLSISDKTDNYVLFESFISRNPTKDLEYVGEEFIHDAFYYRSVMAQFKHMIYKFKEGWIKSERQLILSSGECMSTFHLVTDIKGEKINNFNIYCRSTNVKQMIHDIYLIKCMEEYLKGFFDTSKMETVIIFSNPHLYL